MIALFFLGVVAAYATHVAAVQATGFGWLSWRWFDDKYFFLLLLGELSVPFFILAGISVVRRVEQEIDRCLTELASMQLKAEADRVRGILRRQSPTKDK